MWDLALSDTGDLIFGPHRDLLGSTGSKLTEQRMITRCKVPRGTFAYDVDGTLGSRLHKISSSSTPKQIAQTPAIVQEALEPMNDIHVGNIDVTVDENNRLQIDIKYSPVVSSDESEEIIADSTPEYDARVTV